MALKKSPAAYSWLTWCYSDNAPLLCQGREMCLSRRGVHQGDAMGPLGFALGLEYALDQCLLQQDSLPWVSWYLDDGTIAGPMEQVIAYLRALGPALETCGLQVNLRKCTLWGPGAPATWDNVPADVVPEDHPVRLVPITPWGTDDGL